MMTLEGQYFDGRQPIGAPAKIDFYDREATLTAGTLSKRYVTSQLTVSPRIGSAYRFVNLPDGEQFACADHSFFDSLPQESPSEGLVAWLEDRWGVALACVALVIGALLASYFFGLPAAAERIAFHIPMETERSLGRQSLAWLDQKGWFKPTTIDPATQETIMEGFDRLRSDLALRNYYRLEFRSGKGLGPNAFALPGGTIVITDEMVKAAVTTEEVLAVLAHEIGHVELRHAMRSVLQNSVIAAAAATVTADAASLSVVIAALPTMVAQTKYSRGFETAADEYAFRLLKRKGYSPTAFATLMERLARNEGERGPLTYLSTHPVTAERVRRAREAGAAPGAVGPPLNTANRLLLGQSAVVHAKYSLAVNPMEELDFKTKQEIYDLRRARVLQHPDLAPEKYAPSEAVFGQIIDKRPWWGLYGIYFYGDGKKSIEGPSEQSIFLLNPYLLIGLRDPHAYRTQLAPPGEHVVFYPQPLSIEWEADHARELISYNVRDHYQHMTTGHFLPGPEYRLDLIAYNARDLGFSYLYVDTGSSEGVTPLLRMEKAFRINQFIHLGGSCGYPGGCNNMSPAGPPELTIEVKKIPSRLQVKLWRNEPKSVDDQGDMTVTIQML